MADPHRSLSGRWGGWRERRRPASRAGTAQAGTGCARGLLTPAVITPGGRYRFRWSEVAAQLKEQRAKGDPAS
jgi:hypothetical protein